MGGERTRLQEGEGGGQGGGEKRINFSLQIGALLP